LCADYAAPGVELFVYGRRGFDPNAAVPARFSARQTAEASRAVARLHGLRDDAVLIVQQAQKAIDQGVFHNDVIAVGNRNVLFCHEQAFMDTANTVTRLGKMLAGTQLETIVVREDELSVAEAVETYLFNSQLLTQSDGTMLLVAPEECRRHARVWPYLQELLARKGAIREVLTFDLRESMQNGGGPACLRLRVVLTAAERAAIGARVWLDDALHHDLTVWIARHYRDRLGPAQLADPALLDESRRALDELTGLLRVGAIYPFQKDA
jgi:succinylarginine dihydrolase